ncbi:adenylyl-sulfate kinase [Streptomyces sp. NPDC050704]|uniref:adenylyl-sulfate kinase n=1 Tax=Streptomyces sp. NPDC050704 TaxID=3157219 RepID=UPI0034365160
MTVWLTGPPGAGQPAAAGVLAERLRGAGRRVKVLDIDGTPGARSDGQVRRAGLAAEVLARNGFVVLVPAVEAAADAHAVVRRRHRRSGTAFLDVPLADAQSAAESAAMLMDLLVERNFIR